jgi:hypothetical protein
MPILTAPLVLEGQIQANNLDAAAMASRLNLATVGRQALLYRMATLAAAGTLDVIVQQAIRVIDVWFVKTGAGGGGGGETLTVSNAGAAITNAMAVGAAADTALTRCTLVDRTNRNIAAGGTLRVVTTGAGNDASIVYVMAARN